VSQRFDAFVAALTRLEEALAAPENPLNRDASIQRFEFTFELAWKALQEALRAEGIDAASPKRCLRGAFRQGWVDDEEGWSAMLDDRNRTTHTYDEELARRVYAELARYLGLFEALRERMPRAGS